VAYSINRLYFEYGHAMLLLQGVPAHKLVGPNYVYYGGERSPAYATRAHMKDVQLALVTKCPSNMKLEEVVRVLRAAS
jgi:hypothetical protein